MKCKIIFLFVVFMSCKKQDNIGQPESYILTERNISEDCNAFQLKFKEGKYLLKFSLAGSCKKLTPKQYIQEYVSYLDKNYDSLIHKDGYVIFDYYGLDNSKTIRDSIIKITKRKFNAEVSLTENNGIALR